MEPIVTVDIDDFADDFTDCKTGECRVNVLPLLYQISQILTESEDMANTLAIILNIMEQRMHIVRGAVELYDWQSGSILIREGFGQEQSERANRATAQNIATTVRDTGKAVVVARLHGAVPQLTKEQAPGKAAKGGDKAQNGPILPMICVPIIQGRKVLGTISAERHYENRRLLKQDMELLATIGSMIGPAAELYMLENVKKVQLESENRRLQSALKEKFKPDNIIGNSKCMQEVYELIEKISSTKTTVLILGESGVGKELVANAIHYNSPNAEGPFVKFNCAALPENIVESELFGHEKGSFTGAVSLRKGRFEQADGGTIFLDEVGELTLPVQAKLLRILQERTFERVGGNKPVKVDLRIIAATNRNLADMVERGEFREDLFYRLNVFPITIPALRERGSDIIALADYFTARFAAESGKYIKRISTPALNMLMSYNWPGNVRELENIIERSVILSDDGVIHGYNLPPSLQTSEETGTSFGCGLEAKLSAVEYEMIVESLKTHRGNMTEAARELNLTRRILGLRMAKYDINYKDYRKGDAA